MALAAAPAAAPEPDDKPTAKPAQRSLMVGGRKLHAKAGRDVIVKGRVTAGRTARMQVRSERGWRTVDSDRAGRRGAFRLKAALDTPMRAKTRVVAAGQQRGVGRVHVYRQALASWYGPGLYGNQLGCGGTLDAGTVGVAHKSLPCGTKLTLRHGGETVRARVIDRGPYSGGREFDLTEATAQKLDFSGVGYVLSTR